MAVGPVHCKFFFFYSLDGIGVQASSSCGIYREVVGFLVGGSNMARALTTQVIINAYTIP